jgi:hypothetical protein
MNSKNLIQCKSCGKEYSPAIFASCPLYKCKGKANINYEDTPKGIPIIVPFNFYPENDFEKAISDICDEIKETLIRKNRDYGDSYRKMKEEFGDTALLIRQSDKLGRLKTLQKQKGNVKESIKDTKLDAAGYYILDLACERVKG